MNVTKNIIKSVCYIIIIVVVSGILAIINNTITMFIDGYPISLSSLFSFSYNIILIIMSTILMVYFFISIYHKTKNEEQLADFHKKFKYLTSTNAIYIMQYDVDTQTFIRWTPEADKIMRTFSVTDYFTLVYKEDIDIAKSLVSHMNNRTKKIYSCEYRYFIPDKKHFFWQYNDIFPYEYGDDGRVVSYLGMCRTNDKWHKAMEEMKQLRDKAESANIMKSAFLANMSHEIRTPLNAIIGFSGLLAETDNPKEKKEFNEIINQNNTILLQLINDILDLSRIESGSVDLKNEPFSLLTLITDMDKASKSAYLPKKGVKIIFEKSIDETIVGDKNRISQILNNYITNACKFTDKGSIRISYERKDNGICFSVTDTGIGISQNDMDRIFIRFEKLNSFVQGTGLGLAICLSLAEAMNGKVDVESKEGEGSTFRLWIPVKTEFSEKSKSIKK